MVLANYNLPGFVTYSPVGPFRVALSRSSEKSNNTCGFCLIYFGRRVLDMQSTLCHLLSSEPDYTAFEKTLTQKTSPMRRD